MLPVAQMLVVALGALGTATLVFYLDYGNTGRRLVLVPTTFGSATAEGDYPPVADQNALRLTWVFSTALRCDLVAQVPYRFFPPAAHSGMASQPALCCAPGAGNWRQSTTLVGPCLVSWPWAQTPRER